VSSTASSITVGWDYPRINGGATVMGFELWMDEWAGGNPRLVFDGTDQPTVQVTTWPSLFAPSKPLVPPPMSHAKHLAPPRYVARRASR